jgi:hypothetical protein
MKKKTEGHSARFRKISNFLLSPIIYAISVRPPYYIVRPGIDLNGLLIAYNLKLIGRLTLSDL